ncbi:MAG: LytTR family DNA-binding domain-containing protein [Caulobacter sp.]|nr:LytTR family DNA-binding domain-containing protein [Caulobacter sp.]
MKESAPSPAIASLRRSFIGRLGLVELLVLALIGAFLASIGAFDTDTVDAPRRFAYWIFPLVAGGACGGLIEERLESRPWLAGHPWPRAAALTLLMAVPATLIVSGTAVVLFGARLSVGHALNLYPQVVLICAALVAISWLSRREVLRHALPSPGVAPPELREKLPPKQARARLLAVEAEDHYLRIHTEAGDTLTLMRFADALKALEGMDGVRTHRSWWVARSAVEEARWRRGRGDLVLAGGLLAPVSRAYAARVRTLDWAREA